MEVVSILDSTGFQTKRTLEGMAHFFSSCWSVGLHRTFAQKDMTIVLDYPPELKCKILLLNTTTYLSHKTWRNQAGSSLKTSFHLTPAVKHCLLALTGLLLTWAPRGYDCMQTRLWNHKSSRTRCISQSEIVEFLVF